MKKITLTLITLTIFAISCNQPTRNQTQTTKNETVAAQNYDLQQSEKENAETEKDCPIVWAEDGNTYHNFEWGEFTFGLIDNRSEHIFTAADSVFTSEIRPNEQLRVGEIYTDSFMFLEYTFGGYGYFIVLVHNNKMYSFVADTMCWITIESLNRGDWVEMQWKIDYTIVAGYDEWDIDEGIIIQKFAEHIPIINRENGYETEFIFRYRVETIAEAYQKFLNDKPDIGKHLPQAFYAGSKTYKSNVDDENKNVIYRFDADNNRLSIEVQGEGGEIIIEFEVQAFMFAGDSGVRVSVVYSN